MNIAIAALLVASTTATAAPPRESLAAASVRHAHELAKMSSLSSSRSSQEAWARVHALETGSRVRVIDVTGAPTEGRLAGVTDDRITLTTNGNASPVELERDAIARIQRPTKGSVLGGVLGVAVGALAGVVTSVNLGMKQCGESCNDEKALIGLSLVGMPIAGGFAGAKLMPRAAWTNVYERR